MSTDALTHHTVLTIDSNAIAQGHWEDRARALLQSARGDGDRLSVPRQELVRDGAVSPEEAARYELRDQIARYYRNAVDLHRAHGSGHTQDVVNQLLSTAHGLVEWQTVADQFFPQEALPDA